MDTPRPPEGGEVDSPRPTEGDNVDPPRPSEGDKENDPRGPGDDESQDGEIDIEVEQGDRVDKRGPPEDDEIDSSSGVKRLRDVLSLSLDEGFDLQDAIDNSGAIPSRAQRGDT